MKGNFSDKIIVSGINPSSSKGLHLGNYLGAGKQHVELQGSAKTALYFIANYHSLNTVFEADQVRNNVYNTYLDYMSFGLKPEEGNVIFFVESGVPEIAELNIIINNVVSMAELKRMHAFKDKFATGVSEDNINHGLFNYPVLMAADILIFDADIVPVGEDQAQHVEITRDIAGHFNARYGETLKVPELYLNKETAKVIGTDGERKMSKSLGNSISIFDREDEVRQQIFNVKTDPARIHPTDPGNPEKNVIFSYMKFLDYDQKKLSEFEERYKAGSVGDVEIKKEFFGFFMDYFKSMRAKREELSNNKDFVQKLMEDNNAEARKMADVVLKRTRRAIGLD